MKTTKKIKNNKYVMKTTENVNETKKQIPKRKQVKPYYQLREDFFTNSDTLDFEEIFKEIGLFYMIKINTTLLTHDGIMIINWKRFSNNRRHKELIENIIYNSGWFIVNEEENTFYSLEVNRQLDERGRISRINKDNVNVGRYGKKENVGKVEKPIEDNIEKVEIENHFNKVETKDIEVEEIDDLIVGEILELLDENEIEKAMEKVDIEIVFEKLTDEELDECFNDFETLKQKEELIEKPKLKNIVKPKPKKEIVKDEGLEFLME